MSYIVRMPKLGLEMVSGTLLEWYAAEGDTVTVDDPLAEFESEKSVAEIPAREAGVLRVVFVEPGEEVPPGTPLGIVADPDEDIGHLIAEATDGADTPREPATDEPTPDEPTTAATETADAPTEVKASPRAKRRAEELGVDLSAVEGTGFEGAVSAEDVESAAESSSSPATETAETTVRAAPRARKLAADLGVDLSTVEGTGPDGAVTSADVERAAEAQENAPDAAETGVPVPTERRPLDGVRRTIASRLGQSYREAIHVTVGRRADAEALLAATDAAAAVAPEATLTDVLLRALSATLAAHPAFNATFEDSEHRLYDDQHISLAVDADVGLVAPVIRGINELSFDDLVAARRSLVDRVQEGAYTTDDLRGGTFTVSNLGPGGVEWFTPIINPPQVAILGVNAIERQAVPDASGDPTFHRVLPLSLTFDHRVVDGADAARFLDTLVGHLEAPWPLLPDTVERSERDTGDTALPEGTVTAVREGPVRGHVDAGAFSWQFDGTEKYGGSESAPTPVDLFLGGLASCLLSSLDVQAAKYDVTLDRLEVTTNATPFDDSVERLDVTVTIDCDADDARVDRMVEFAERSCHVAELLRESVPLTVEWERV